MTCQVYPISFGSAKKTLDTFVTQLYTRLKTGHWAKRRLTGYRGDPFNLLKNICFCFRPIFSHDRNLREHTRFCAAHGPLINNIIHNNCG